MPKKKYTFIVLFASIGGFRTAMCGVGGTCAFFKVTFEPILKVWQRR